MADNVAITAGSGTTLATDDISSVHYQRVKVTWGADGTATDASTAAPLPVIPLMITGGVMTPVTTAAVGTNWTAFGSQTVKRLILSNQTGTTIEYRIGGAGSGMTVPTGVHYAIEGITNANTVSIRRFDTSNTQVVVQAAWEA